MNPEHPAHGEVKVESSKALLKVIMDHTMFGCEDGPHFDGVRMAEAAYQLGRAETLMAIESAGHDYWGAGEADCPREIKAGNGELHTLRCKRCGEDNPKRDYCLPSLTTPPATDLIQRLDQARSDALAAGEAPHIPYDWLVETIAALRSPPTTDVALREVVHKNGPVVVDYMGTDLAWRPLDYGTWTPFPTPPDQPQIGDEVVERMKYLLDASPDDYWTKITTEVKAAGNQVRHACLLNHEAAHLLAWAEIARNAAIARAAIAAMPKEDIWEEAARFAHEIADGMRFVGDTDEGRIRHDGLVAGARFVAAALRARRAK